METQPRHIATATQARDAKSSWPMRVWRFYYDGFRNLSPLGRKLWLLILIKLFIFFVVLKIFFFPDLLAGKSPSEKAGCVLENLTPEIPQP